MSRFTAYALLAHLLASNSVAQNVTQPTCSELGSLIRYNASTSRQIPAFSISNDVYSGDDNFPDPNRSFRMENDTSRNWTLSLRVHERPPLSSDASTANVEYEQTLLLDTAGSNVTRMGVCHALIPAQDPARAFRWTKAVLERSLKDNGDCKTMLSEKCVDALKQHYREQAFEHQMDKGCDNTNVTVPKECAGMMAPRTELMNVTYDLSSLNGSSSRNTSIRFDPSVECDGLNASSTHALHATHRLSNTGLSYNEAIRFPLLDIITFWPNRPMSPYKFTGSRDDVRVEVVCMRPDQVAQGSKVPPSGEELLKEGTTFRNVTGEDALSAANVVSLGHGMLVWMSTAAVGMILLL